MPTTKAAGRGDAGVGLLVGEALAGALMGALCAFVLLLGCEGADAGGGQDVAVTADVAEVVEGSGPPATCGGVRTGDFVGGGGVGADGASSLSLRVGSEGRPLNFVVRAGGGDIVLLGFINEAVPAGHRPQWGADRQTVRVGPVLPAPTSDAAVSGAVFDALNNGFGGNVVEGRFCFDAPPQTGQPLSGSWVFVLAVGAEEAIHRVQGTFAVPGEAVTVGPGDALVVEASPGATVTVE